MERATIKKQDVKFSEDSNDVYNIGLYWDSCYKIYAGSEDIGITFLINGEDNSEYGDSSCIYIQWIEIQKDKRGQGYMQDVLRCLKTEFSQKKYITAETNDDHLEMYKHLSFEVVSRDEFREMTFIRYKIKSEIKIA